MFWSFGGEDFDILRKIKGKGRGGYSPTLHGCSSKNLQFGGILKMYYGEGFEGF